uniref:Uncharacterized protein n=1 Tax=Lotus japonicus TaxID=34305 RepID=I3T9H1_LOTJA|nr:unknown [Lotus japonicus]
MVALHNCATTKQTTSRQISINLKEES